MDAVFHNTFVSTKEAGKLSGYTSDYLALMARSGKITGKRMGHNWVLERESLMSFLERKVRANVVRAEELARLRVDEYRAAQASAVTLPTTRLRREAYVPSSSTAIPAVSFLMNAGAALAAVLVVFVGMYGSQMRFSPAVTEATMAAVEDAATGARDMAAVLIAQSASRYAAATQVAIAGSGAATTVVHESTEALAYPALAYPDTSVFALPVPRNTAVSLAAQAAAVQLTAARAPLTLAGMRGAFEHVTLAAAGSAVVQAYIALGNAGYESIVTLERGYLAVLAASGPAGLALGAGLRDMAVALPAQAYSGLSLLGQAEVEGAHAAIALDVSAAYFFARTGPALSKQSFALVSGAGENAMFAAAYAERDAMLALSYVSGWPSLHAPHIAAAAWSVEYASASRFTAASQRITGAYLALVEGAGDTAYQGAHGALAYLGTGSHALGADRLYAAAISALGLAPPR